MSGLYSAWKATYLSLIEDPSIPQSLQWSILALILLFCLVVRLITIDVPPLDRTMWKEIDYIEISKNYVKNDFNFFKPEITWPAEPSRVTAMELPLVPFAAAILYKLFGYNVFTVRFIPMICWLMLVVYVFLLARREFGPIVGLGAAMASAIMPLYHEFRNILFSEPFVIASSVATIYYFANWIDFGRKRDWILAVVAFSLAVALKLTPLYLLLPLLWAAFRKYRFEFGNYRGFAGLVFLSLLLPIVWYLYAYYLTLNSIDVFGIFGGHDKMQTLTMLADNNWWLTMMIRLRWEILGGKFGILLFALGLMATTFVRRGGLIYTYLIAVVCFMIIVAEGHLDAPYRQLTFVPPLSVFIGLGAMAFSLLPLHLMSRNHSKITTGKPIWQRLSIITFVGLSLISSMIFYNQEKIFHGNIDGARHPQHWKLAQEVRKYTNPGDKLIAIREYTCHKGGNDLSPVIYYYTGLQGWTLQSGFWTLTNVESLIAKGANLLVVTGMCKDQEVQPFIDQIRKHYWVLYENKNPGLLILDLKRPL